MEWKKSPDVRSVKIFHGEQQIAEYNLYSSNGDSVNIVDGFLVVDCGLSSDLYSPFGFTRVENTLLTD